MIITTSELDHPDRGDLRNPQYLRMWGYLGSFGEGGARLMDAADYAACMKFDATGNVPSTCGFM